nr:hypothetical protein [Rhodococcus sp. (in: high G+C Gram-positive bacteria)]
MLNAACFIVTGVAGLIFAVSGNNIGAIGWLVTLGCIAYGLYIAFTKGSYWIADVIYLVPIFGIGYLYFSATGAI